MEDNVKKGPSALVLPVLLLVILLILLFIFLKSCGGYFKSSEDLKNNQPGYAHYANNAGDQSASLSDTTVTLKDTATAATPPVDSTAKR